MRPCKLKLSADDKFGCGADPVRGLAQTQADSELIFGEGVKRSSGQNTSRNETRERKKEN